MIWPCLLLGYGAGGEYGDGRGELRKGRRFSTSRNVVVHVGEVLERYSADALRYYLTAAGPETQDTDFTWAESVRRNNDELVASWGNLVNRVLTSAHRSYGEVHPAGGLSEDDRAVIADVESGFDVVRDLIETTRFRAALAEAMQLASRAVVAEELARLEARAADG